MENVNLVELIGQQHIENIRLRLILQRTQLENSQLKEKIKSLEPERETESMGQEK